MTEKGHSLVEEFGRVFDLAEEKMMAGLTEDERRTLIMLMRKMLTSLESSL